MNILAGGVHSVLGVAVAVASSGCARTLPRSTTVAPAANAAAVVYLIGDAGAPAPDEPVLRALKADIRERTETERRVVFLGDNIYPDGLPPEHAAGRAEAERRIRAQFAVGLETQTPVVFVPGNHDWGASDGNGRETVRRQERFVETTAPDLVRWLPDDGCPGPAVHDLNAHVRLILLDTTWWLRDAESAEPVSGCAFGSRTAVVAGLRDAIQSAGARTVVVAAHHPLATASRHGDHFTLGQHIFPLRDWQRWMWLPLPGLGSLYPLSRQLGITDQDVSSRRYRALRAALDSVFTATPPAVYAAGHAHGLEILDGGNRAGALVVSGAGSLGNTEAFGATERTRFVAPGRAGFVRLEFESSGRVRLSVVVVDKTGARTEVYSSYVARQDRSELRGELGPFP